MSTREVMRMALDALDKLSKLGNGGLDGNSEGNVIAQEARNKLHTELEKPEPIPFAWAACCQGQEVMLFKEEPSDERFPSKGCWKEPLYREEDV